MRNPSFKFTIFLCGVFFLAFAMNAQEKPASKPRARDLGTVSYTHLTLPTICSV